MNAGPDIVAGAAEQQALDEVLAPLSSGAPCGPPAHHDPVFTEIRLLREEDDPSLPMGQWERPLRYADWPRIEACCIAMLTTRSKDLQLAAWLVESWMRQRGFVGLAHGLHLLDTLLRSYWPSLHPMIDDGGECDARLAPLEWLNESLSGSVRVHAALLYLDECKPPHVTLADWERMTAQDMAAPDAAARNIAGTPTRSGIYVAAQRLRPALAATADAVERCLEYLHSIIVFLNAQLGAESPNLSKLQSTMEAARRVLLQLQPGQAAGMCSASMDDGAPDCAPDGDGVIAPPGSGRVGAAPCDERPGEAQEARAATVTAGWHNRGEAYRTLEALADYLTQVEPHSPAPFLIRRAANWGRMPLPQVLAEIISEEGSLDRLVHVLGLKL
jgi:type VI secretion system protein ImpA